MGKLTYDGIFHENYDSTFEVFKKLVGSLYMYLRNSQRKKDW
jgi:hypothetical protein